MIRPWGYHLLAGSNVSDSSGSNTFYGGNTGSSASATALDLFFASVSEAHNYNSKSKFLP